MQASLKIEPLSGLCIFGSTCCGSAELPASESLRRSGESSRHLATRHLGMQLSCIARPRFQTPKQSGHPNHSHRKSTVFLGLRKGSTGEERAIPRVFHSWTKTPSHITLPGKRQRCVLARTRYALHWSATLDRQVFRENEIVHLMEFRHEAVMQICELTDDVSG